MAAKSFEEEWNLRSHRSGEGWTISIAMPKKRWKRPTSLRGLVSGCCLWAPSYNLQLGKPSIMHKVKGIGTVWIPIICGCLVLVPSRLTSVDWVSVLCVGGRGWHNDHLTPSGQPAVKGWLKQLSLWINCLVLQLLLPKTGLVHSNAFVDLLVGLTTEAVFLFLGCLETTFSTMFCCGCVLVRLLIT